MEFTGRQLPRQTGRLERPLHHPADVDAAHRLGRELLCSQMRRFEAKLCVWQMINSSAMLLRRQFGDAMHGKSDSTTTPAREQRGEILQLTQQDEQAPAADGDEMAALRAIVEGTARDTGAVFFQSLVRHLATAIGVDYAFVAEFADKPTRVRTLAYWGKGETRENVEFDLAGTPCEDVVRGGLCHHPSGVKERFPRDQPLVAMGIESYLGVPLHDARGEILGHLAVFDERPMPAEPRKLFTFRIFAARAAAELERLRYEQRLRESEDGTEIFTRKLLSATSRKISNRDSSVPIGPRSGYWVSSPTKWSARSGCRSSRPRPRHSDGSAKPSRR